LANSGNFNAEFGVKIVRGVAVTSFLEKNDNSWKYSIEIDPIQYKEDLSSLVT